MLKIGQCRLMQCVSSKRFRDVGPISFMLKNFAASWTNILRPWTLVTSCFSHRDVGHIFINLFSFYFMGQAALAILSSSRFIGLYLLAGLAGNAVQLVSDLLTKDLMQRPAFALGASGSISGVLSFFAMAFPTPSIYIFGILPLPAWAAVTGIVGYDIYLALFRPVSVPKPVIRCMAG